MIMIQMIFHVIYFILGLLIGDPIGCYFSETEYLPAITSSTQEVILRKLSSQGTLLKEIQMSYQNYIKGIYESLSPYLLLFWSLKQMILCS